MTRGTRNIQLSTPAGGAAASRALWCEDAFFNYCCAVEEAGKVRLFWDLKSLSPDQYPIAVEIYRDTNLGEGTSLPKVAGPLYDTWTFVDEPGPIYSGKLKTPVYRIKLLTAKQEHLSAPIRLFANLPPRKITLARAIIRRLELNARHLPCWPGYLLKRRWTGEPCTCRDPDTKDVYNSDCQNCFGTGIKLGYWKDAISRTIAACGPLNTLPIFDKNLQLGNTTTAIFQAKISGLPPVNQYDAWVAIEGNYRFYITNIKVDAEINAVPLVYTVELSLAEKGDILYSVPLD